MINGQSQEEIESESEINPWSVALGVGIIIGTILNLTAFYILISEKNS